MNDSTGLVPQPERRLITTRREYLAAMDALLTLARRELAIFDPDLALLGLNSRPRIALLQAFLDGARDRRLRIAVHDEEHLKHFCPRLMDLLALHHLRVAIHRTEGEAARIEDCFILADAEHFVRRRVARQGRGAVGLNDPQEGRGLYGRFEEIWQSSVPAVSATTSGL